LGLANLLVSEKIDPKKPLGMFTVDSESELRELFDRVTSIETKFSFMNLYVGEGSNLPVCFLWTIKVCLWNDI
jgi:hypothetical protein